MQRLRSASVPSKRTSSILNPEHAMEFLDRQLGHKPQSKTRKSLAEDSVSEPSKEISSSTSSVAVKNMFSRVTSLFVDHLNFVSFAPQVSTAGSRSGSAESFELVESDQIPDTGHSKKTEGHLERHKSSSRSSDVRELQLPKQSMITQVWSWGKGAYGQLGHGDDLDRMQPCLMKHLNDSGVLKVSAGHGHSLALTCSFSVFSWGLNDVSQLGHNPAAKCISTPKLVAVSSLAEDLEAKAALAATGLQWQNSPHGSTLATRSQHAPSLNSAEGMPEGGPCRGELAVAILNAKSYRLCFRVLSKA
ncbi:hypothetical protein HPB49_006943 [Dermacentor silvarum]|uniref:Uncharacterized protein n=1 Tax=Dermacentor silvarum TaxID=543639 RepID=A0ACB8DWX8_DERSI|nr:hypothetical protein HPB49_006943 [Dermacentor silvarum]